MTIFKVCWTVANLRLNMNNDIACTILCKNIIEHMLYEMYWLPVLSETNRYFPYDSNHPASNSISCIKTIFKWIGNCCYCEDSKYNEKNVLYVIRLFLYIKLQTPALPSHYPFARRKETNIQLLTNLFEIKKNMYWCKFTFSFLHEYNLTQRRLCFDSDCMLLLRYNAKNVNMNPKNIIIAKYQFFVLISYVVS